MRWKAQISGREVTGLSMDDLNSLARRGKLRPEDMVAGEDDQWGLALHCPVIDWPQPSRLTPGHKAGIWIVAALMAIVPLLLGLIRLTGSDPSQRAEGIYMIRAAIICIFGWLAVFLVFGCAAAVAL